MWKFRNGMKKESNLMTRYAFYTADVFTSRRFGGNPLAVLPDARGLDSAAMQTITREFNYSESVFVLPPDNPTHTRRLRIFTPGAEMPFAGHPTVGHRLHPGQPSATFPAGRRRPRSSSRKASARCRSPFAPRTAGRSSPSSAPCACRNSAPPRPPPPTWPRCSAWSREDLLGWRVCSAGRLLRRAVPVHPGAQPRRPGAHPL